MQCVICQIYRNITLQYIYTVSLIINGTVSADQCVQIPFEYIQIYIQSRAVNN